MASLVGPYLTFIVWIPNFIVFQYCCFVEFLFALTWFTWHLPFILLFLSASMQSCLLMTSYLYLLRLTLHTVLLCLFVCLLFWGSCSLVLNLSKPCLTNSLTWTFVHTLKLRFCQKLTLRHRNYFPGTKVILLLLCSLFVEIWQINTVLQWKKQHIFAYNNTTNFTTFWSFSSLCLCK